MKNEENSFNETFQDGKKILWRNRKETINVKETSTSEEIK